MQKTINLFVDMDGTLTQMPTKNTSLENIYEQDYFANLKPYALAKAINDFASKDSCVNIYILSACVDSKYCESEKVAWLFENMPNIDPNHYIFTKIGESKVSKAKEIVEDFGENINILQDDYVKNLEKWQEHSLLCMGVKFINGLNNGDKSWKGKKIRKFSQLEDYIKMMSMYGTEYPD